MHPLDSQLQNPLVKEQNRQQRTRLQQLFPVLTRCKDRHFLAMRPYLLHRPQKFFSPDTFNLFFDWLENIDKHQRQGLQQYIESHLSEISNGLRFLREINAESWHDEMLQAKDDYERLRIIDRHVHSTYLRLIEGVLAPLCRLPAYFSRRNAGKGTDGLDIYPIVEELKNSPLQAVTAFYEHTMRNGIGHGGITYLQDGIRYNDKKGNEKTFDASSIIRLCDDLLDTCNGLAAALKAFLIIHQHEGYTLPQELLLQELREETNVPWWSIEGCIQSEIAGKPQLLIYAQPKTRDYGKVQYVAIQSGILAEYFAPGFDRYFISLRSPKNWTGWAGFDGKKIEALRLAGTNDISGYQGIVENNLVFYLPKFKLPKILQKPHTLLLSFRLMWPLFLEHIRVQLGAPRVTARHAKIHRNAWGCVLGGSVVIEDYGTQDPAMIVRKYRKKIIRAALSLARKEAGRMQVVSHLPIGYARIGVFRRDYRRRRLSSFGLGEDLMCTVQLQRIGRIKAPDIMGSTIEAKGKWRIAWNKAWSNSSL